MSSLGPIRRSGFTLVEILVVVVILGIAGAVIVPQIGGRDDLKASAAARMLMADLIYAQNMAITQQTNHFVVFTTGSPASYRVASGSSLTTITHPINKTNFIVTFGSSGTQGMREMTLVSATFKGGSTTTYGTLGFDELGTPVVHTGTNTETLTSGSITIRCGNHQCRIDVEPYTGQITVTSL